LESQNWVPLISSIVAALSAFAVVIGQFVAQRESTMKTAAEMSARFLDDMEQVSNAKLELAEASLQLATATWDKERCEMQARMGALEENAVTWAAERKALLKRISTLEEALENANTKVCLELSADVADDKPVCDPCDTCDSVHTSN